MVEDGGGATTVADADSILLSARRAAELTRDLLGSRAAMPTAGEQVRPESLITSVVSLVSRTLPEGIKVETSFGDELAAIEGDPAQLSHALVNLCIDAADAMDEHGVLTIGAHRRRGGDGDAVASDHVVLSVTDTGAGMDGEQRGQRVDGSTDAGISA